MILLRHLFSDHVDLKVPSVLAWLLGLVPWILLVPCALYLVPCRRFFLLKLQSLHDFCSLNLHFRKQNFNYETEPPVVVLISGAFIFMRE